MSETAYNGWENYPTWCVYFWVSNNDEAREFWLDKAGDIYHERRKLDDAWEQSINALADRLQEETEANHPYRGVHLPQPIAPDFYCDLLDTSLIKVNYHEIAEKFLDDLEESGYFQDRYDNDRYADDSDYLD